VYVCMPVYINFKGADEGILFSPSQKTDMGRQATRHSRRDAHVHIFQKESGSVLLYYTGAKKNSVFHCTNNSAVLNKIP
jgi:hypothetical protein